VESGSLLIARLITAKTPGWQAQGKRIAYTGSSSVETCRRQANTASRQQSCIRLLDVISKLFAANTSGSQVCQAEVNCEVVAEHR
jgi:phage-related protein